MTQRSLSPRGRWVIVTAMAAFAYAVLLGGTGLGELHPWLRVANGVVAGPVIVGYVWLAPGRMDRIDQGCLAGLLVFLLAGVMSGFLRQSMDAVLAALTYAAVFFVARRLVADEAGRAALLRTMWALSTVLTLVAAARWLPLMLEWWALTGWRVSPPLDMNLSGVLWGHRHDLALAVALLYPSWWVGRPGRARAAAGTVFGILTLLIVIVAGSRTLWLALLVASLSLAVPPFVRFWRRDRRYRSAMAAAALLMVVGAAASGLAGAAVDRVLTTNTIVSRADLWGPLIGAWLERPIAGFGPGSFPWVLQQTNYFDMNTWAPRHPDSVLFQLLPELGLLGLIAVTAVLAVVVPGVMRGPPAARWALIVFVVAGIGSNPTEFAFLILIAIAWAAYANPNRAMPARTRSRAVLVTAYAMLAVLGIAYGAAAAGAIAYDGARVAIARGDLTSAAAQLGTARTLDPSLALYPRELGAIDLAEGDARDAVMELQAATRQNPIDDLSWRTLALAYEATGDGAAMQSALDQAVSLQRSDPTNLLLRMYFESRSGREADALATAAEVVRAWPWIVAAPAWSDLAAPASNAEILAGAVARWQQGSPAPLSTAPHGIWLAILGNRDDLLATALRESGLSPTLARTYAAVLRCDPSADAYLRDASASDRRFDEYWALRVRDASRRGVADPDASRALEIMQGRKRAPEDGDETLSPLNENADPGFSTDAWGYRRPPVAWPQQFIVLPSPDAAVTRWLLAPAAAASAADLGEALASCT
jgi:O-antigen ligase/tetratricopeptide (TPR) repeat protein